METIFDFDLFPFLKPFEGDYLIYRLNQGNLQDEIVRKQMKYCPGIYLVYDYTDNKKGDLLYYGKAGADINGKINKHQLPKRLLATCNLPPNYPALNGRIKDITRDVAWVHMMQHDKISSILIFYFYTNVVTTNGMIKAEPAPAKLEEKVRVALFSNKVTKFRWSTKRDD